VERKFNWVAFLLLTVFYLPFYLVKKKRCPICKGTNLGNPVSEQRSVQVRQESKKDSITNNAVNEGLKSSPIIDHSASLGSVDIVSMVIQAMESSYLVATSKAIDTVVSRYELLKARLNGLKSARSRGAYLTSAQEGIDRFKLNFYNTIPADYQIAIVTEPDKFDLSEFYARSLLNCFRLYSTMQFEQIGNLKKEDAKQRRLSKVREVLDQVIGEVERECKGSPSYDVVHGTLLEAREAIERGNLDRLG